MLDSIKRTVANKACTCMVYRGRRPIVRGIVCERAPKHPACTHAPPPLHTTTECRAYYERHREAQPEEEEHPPHVRGRFHEADEHHGTARLADIGMPCIKGSTCPRRDAYQAALGLPCASACQVVEIHSVFERVLSGLVAPRSTCRYCRFALLRPNAAAWHSLARPARR